jgi:hypothetical protein
MKTDLVQADCAFSGSTGPKVPTCNYPTSNFLPTGCNCQFTCINGWVQCGNNCIDPTMTACVSGIPLTLGGGGGASGGNSRRSHMCPPGREYCRAGRSGWECLDTSSDLEACGGCPYSGVGVDCSALPGAGSVACVEGKCVIQTCDQGYTLRGTDCVQIS